MMGYKVVDQENLESEGERDQSSQEVNSGDQRDERDESEGKDSGSDHIGQRVVTSRRQEVVESDSKRSEENQSPKEEKDEAHISDTVPEIRDVFGESDDEEPADYDAAQTNIEDDTNQIGVVGVNFNARTHAKSFNGLKAATSESCEPVSSFTRKESSAVLHHSFAWKNHNLSQTSLNVFQDVVAMQSSAPPWGLNEARPKP
nr:protein LEO1 homolog isoform X2 [Tanacetum cinerariifolium]